MNAKCGLRIIVIAAAVVLANYASAGSLTIVRQVTSPPTETNGYLLYDEPSGEAALVDVGGPDDTLISIIEKKGLKLKYIFITHCHPDHVFGLPEVKKRFPDAKIALSKVDYEDAKLYSQWEKKLPPEAVAEIKRSPETVKMMSFDISSVCTPDIFLEDNQILKLGEVEIRAILSPGHSRGSVCYAVGNALFSGDVLFYRTVGRTDLEGMSWDSIVSSVRRLYSLLPDETIVYPSHGQSTTIGAEKKENRKVPADTTAKP